MATKWICYAAALGGCPHNKPKGCPHARPHELKRLGATRITCHPGVKGRGPTNPDCTTHCVEIEEDAHE